MDCPQALPLLSTHLDGELTPEERAALEAHLAYCADCRAATEELRLQDAKLRRAFTPRRARAATVADRVIASLQNQGTGQTGWLPWLASPLALAAGVLIAVVSVDLWRPQREDPEGQLAHLTKEREALANERKTFGDLVQQRQQLDKEKIEVGQAKTELAKEKKDLAIERDLLAKQQIQLVVATGAVEVLTSGKKDWQPMPTGGTLPPGTRVRTGPKARCEFRTPDNSEVRLNTNTELVFHSHRQLELAQGQVWSNVAGEQEPYQVKVPQADATITALGTQFDVQSESDEALVTVVQGMTKVEVKGGEEFLKVGEQVKIVNGKVEGKTEVRDLVMATSWIHELLTLKGRDNEELVKRLDDILAQIGRSKIDHLYEREILALGDHSIVPLFRYVQSDLSRKEQHKRITAARLFARVARSWSIHDLIVLLGDEEPDIRFFAAKALGRITDGVLEDEIKPTDWRDLPQEKREDALKKWHNWWEEHKGFYPSPR